MITLILAVSAGIGGFSAAYWPADWGLGWSIFIGIVCFGVVQGVAGMMMRKRVMRDMERVQGILGNGQKALQTKMQRWQFRPPSSMQEAQREMMRDTRTFVLEALKEVESLGKYRWWVPLIDRQMATAKLQLNWMIKEFGEVDKFMPKALLIDPTMVAMKMARMYMQDVPSKEIEKVYRKAAIRAKYNQNVLIAATWSWILVQRKDLDGAFKVLGEALKKSDNEALKRNHEALMNNRPQQFNNSGIGDMWYSLYLDEPKIRSQRQHHVYR